MVLSIRNTAGVRCREVIRFSEGPLREVRLYMFVVHPPRCQPRSTKGSRLFGAAAGGSTGGAGPGVDRVYIYACAHNYWLVSD